MTQQFAVTVPREGSPADQLREHLEGLRHLLKTDQELWAVASEVALRAARDAVIADIVRQGDDQWYPLVRGLVARGVEEEAYSRAACSPRAWQRRSLPPSKASACRGRARFDPSRSTRPLTNWNDGWVSATTSDPREG